MTKGINKDYDGECLEKVEGDSCGGPLVANNGDCPEGLFCDPNECPEESNNGPTLGGDPAGVCMTIPTGACFCMSDLNGNLVAPQCGCDGVTYDCECARLKAGVGLADEDVCPETCDTNGDCTEENNFCKKDLGDCDGEGVCDKKPLVFSCLGGPGGVLSLTACGCDGENYDSVCHAHAAGVSVFAKDECP